MPKKEEISYQEHPDPAVRRALTKLSDALYDCKRDAGVSSVLILREVSYCYRAQNGKPLTADDRMIQDRDLLAQLGGA